MFCVGVRGRVIDDHGDVMREATVQVNGSRHEYKVSANLAYFHIILPPGLYQLQVSHHTFLIYECSLNSLLTLSPRLAIPSGHRTLRNSSGLI